jgi:SAM-dependent methyltransferase
VSDGTSTGRRLTRAYARLEDLFQRLALDRRYGLPAQASRDVSLRSFGYAAPGRRDYAASSWNVLARILERGEIGSEDVFLDVGCGFGRVVLAAARYPFKRVIGVDIVPEFTAAAADAVARNRHRLRCGDVRLITADAASWSIPDEVTFAFLGDSFRGEVLEAFVSQLVASAERRPRRLRLIFYGPSGVHPLDEIPQLALVRRGRRALRRWAPADYLTMYEVIQRTAS